MLSNSSSKDHPNSQIITVSIAQQTFKASREKLLTIEFFKLMLRNDSNEKQSSTIDIQLPVNAGTAKLLSHFVDTRTVDFKDINHDFINIIDGLRLADFIQDDELKKLLIDYVKNTKFSKSHTTAHDVLYFTPSDVVNCINMLKPHVKTKKLAYIKAELDAILQVKLALEETFTTEEIQRYKNHKPNTRFDQALESFGETKYDCKKGIPNDLLLLQTLRTFLSYEGNRHCRLIYLRILLIACYGAEILREVDNGKVNDDIDNFRSKTTQAFLEKVPELFLEEARAWLSIYGCLIAMHDDKNYKYAMVFDYIRALDHYVSSSMYTTANLLRAGYYVGQNCKPADVCSALLVSLQPYGVNISETGRAYYNAAIVHGLLSQEKQKITESTFQILFENINYYEHKRSCLPQVWEFILPAIDTSNKYQCAIELAIQILRGEMKERVLSALIHGANIIQHSYRYEVKLAPKLKEIVHHQIGDSKRFELVNLKLIELSEQPNLDDIPDETPQDSVELFHNFILQDRGQLREIYSLGDLDREDLKQAEAAEQLLNEIKDENNQDEPESGFLEASKPCCR